MTFQVFKSILDQLFYTVSPHFGFVYCFFIIKLLSIILGTISQEWFCSYQGYSITRWFLSSFFFIKLHFLVIRIFLVGRYLRLCKYPVPHPTSPTSVRVHWEFLSESTPTAYACFSLPVVCLSLWGPMSKLSLALASRNSIQYGFCLFVVFLSFVEHFLTVWHSKIFQVNLSFSAQLWIV